MTPRASIVIPLYNKEGTIERAMASVLGQTESDIELIVVDDGSTDHSAAVARGQRDSRIRIVRQPNRGPGAARNHGMRLARATYINFLDADDELLPDFVSTGLEVLEDRPECALVNFSWYWGEAHEDYSTHHRRRGIRDGRYSIDERLGPAQIKQQVDYMHSGAILARKDVVMEHGGFYEAHRCTYGEDSYLWIQVLLNCVLYRVPRPLMWFHCEDSELGKGRKTVHPIVPQLVEHQDYLQRFSGKQRAVVRRIYSDYLFLAMNRSYLSRSLTIARQVLHLMPAVFQPEPACVNNYLKTLIRYIQLLYVCTVQPRLEDL